MSEQRITKTPVEVYAELTPNPDSMKFVTSIMLLEGKTAEYESAADAADSPLAQQLFQFTGVKKIFITANFITVTKDSHIDWYDITNILREFVKSFLVSGEKPFSTAPKPVLQPEKETAFVNDSKDPAIEQKIKELLDEYVRPAVEGDGGAIHFESFNQGIVNVVLKGACSGCPSSTVTLKAGIENLLKRLIPEVKEVVAINA